MRKKTPHLQRCRERIMDAMEGDEEEIRRRRDDEERVNSRMEAHIERYDRKGEGAVDGGTRRGDQGEGRRRGHV